MSTHHRYGKHSPCTNCGNFGHHFRSCTAPITSYGIVAFRVLDPAWKQERQGIDSTKIEYLLIQRRDSIGFVELLRAKYKLSDLDYISQQVAGITQQERDKLLALSFEALWVGLWGTTGETRQYRQEYEQAKAKFESLREGYTHDDKTVSFKMLFETIPVQWSTPEWGFPKGRRNAGETDLVCAMREFQEETGLSQREVHVFPGVEPFKETFMGNNKIRYSHIYYLAWISPETSVVLKEDNPTMTQEVGNIEWLSYDAAMKRIRPVNQEKKDVLAKVHTMLTSTAAEEFA